MMVKRYFLNIATVLFDEFPNVLIGGNPHETISDRAALARAAGRKWGCVLCKFLDWVAPGHCDGALKVVETPMAQEFTGQDRLL